LITRNVEGLQQKPGACPERIVEIHRTLLDVVCMACGDRAPMQRALARVRAGEVAPACVLCGGILKSATMSLGQSLVAADLRCAEQAARQCDLMLAVGSSLTVFPVAAIVPLVKQCGARVVIVNGQATEMDHLADAVLHGAIGAILPRLVSARKAAP
jgi:NAD-dependent deacetylase